MYKTLTVISAFVEHPTLIGTRDKQSVDPHYQSGIITAHASRPPAGGGYRYSCYYTNFSSDKDEMIRKESKNLTVKSNGNNLIFFISI